MRINNSFIRHCTLSICFACIVLLGAAPASLAKSNTDFTFKRPAIALPLMKQAPTIDGVIHTNEWAGADKMIGFTQYHASGKLTAQTGAFWVGADSHNLYIAVRTQTPPDNKLLARANPIKGGSSVGSVLADDAIELRVCPNPNAPRNKQRVYFGAFNAKGAAASQLRSNPPRSWQGKWTVKNSVSNNHWDCEITIPWSSFGVQSPAGKTMAIRIARDWRQTIQGGKLFSEWGLGKTNFWDVSSMPRVTWTGNAPVVQLVQLQNQPGGGANIQLSLYNPASAPMKLQTHILVQPAFSNFTKENQTIILAPGQTRLIRVRPAANDQEWLKTHIEVTGRTAPKPKAPALPLYYLRDFTWQRVRDSDIWNLHPNQAKRISLKFAYFPSYHAMHVKVDLSNLPTRSKVQGIQLFIRKKGSNQNIAHATLPPLQNNITQIRQWKLPVLTGGKYELVAKLNGIDIKPIVKTFVRDHFKWENNKLGTADILVPPYTPITIKNHTLGVILRQYQLNDVGLWDQVTSEGKKLLAAPMTLSAIIDGKKITAQGNLNVDKRSKSQAATTARWSVGALHGITKNVWYQDGVMKSTITLLPPSQPVSRLTINIPLNPKIARLMHVVTLYTSKQPYSKAIPKGTGVIWKSSQIPNHFIGNYVGYLWVGGPGRGVAVFGSNDAGWITNSNGDLSCQQLIRKPDGSLVLQLNLIQKTSTWKTPRKIVIGFQATPAKPMPRHWRLWSVSAARDSLHASKLNVPGMYKQGRAGSRTYLGGITSFSNVFPGDGTKQDYTLWKAFKKARATGKYDPAFGKQWVKMAMAKYRKLRPKKAKSRTKAILRSVLGMLRPLSTQPQGVLIYTDPRAMSPYTPQAQTYLNEWSRAAFPKRQWAYGSSSDYGVDPVKSYRDMRVWYYQKSLKAFTDGIYWDNVFLAANNNPITSPAYVMADGKIQPADGIWHMRKLIYRTAVMMKQMGMSNRNMVHMSGTAMVPVIDFSATQYGWELQYGAGDFQTKFPRDFIQTESIGRQAGLVPIVLMVNNRFIVGTKKQKAWQYRTAAGVMLTHEIKPSSSNGQYGKPDPFWSNYDKLVKFGYGQSAKVYNYWQDGYPAKISGESSSLLISKPKAGAAMLVVCDYSHDNKPEHTFNIMLDKDKLGLSGNLMAVDADTGKSLSVNGDTITIKMKTHDFMVIKITANSSRKER